MFFSFSAFGGSTSLAARNKTCITKGFESFQAATKRTSRDKIKLSTGDKRPHNHSGTLSNFVWESKACLERVYN